MMVLFALLQALEPDSAGVLELLDSLRQRIQLSDDVFASPQQALAKRLTAFRPWYRPPTLTQPVRTLTVLTNGYIKNITLSADEKIIERARKAAQGMGKSLNQAVRDYLEQLAAGDEGLDAELEALRSMAGRGNSGGQRIRRNELYAERLERQRGA